jgi:hypothetical protein
MSKVFCEHIGFDCGGVCSGQARVRAAAAAAYACTATASPASASNRLQAALHLPSETALILNGRLASSSEAAKM